ncbi:hypothetical protein J4T94_gp091 [Mycobacterium phage Krypton555]|uniref:Uncharacterized protein n=1 Tax=Mycobacterium phage Krypton555 TaxID=2015885 RepID=A0A222ZR05_9CAUD|nr:hypothetical protein J4T94_gp091 [Mycobacterium phage Krypton555]ASR87127.1 hypothetical protein KRYPTON555_91 [Mycobacterium phage Krypton555]
MRYTLLAGSRDGLALVMHEDGETYRYNLNGQVIAYQLADHAGAFYPGTSETWHYVGKTFDSVQQMQVWWRYERTGV